MICEYISYWPINIMHRYGRQQRPNLSRCKYSKFKFLVMSSLMNITFIMHFTSMQEFERSEKHPWIRGAQTPSFIHSASCWNAFAIKASKIMGLIQPNCQLLHFFNTNTHISLVKCHNREVVVFYSFLFTNKNKL